jgi:hypothetical protein
MQVWYNHKIEHIVDIAYNQNVVSFQLSPVFDSSHNLQAVCVIDITPAEKLKIHSED